MIQKKKQKWKEVEYKFIPKTWKHAAHNKDGKEPDKLDLTGLEREFLNFHYQKHP